MGPAVATRTVLVGHGNAGNRFLRALRHGRCAQLFDVVAIVDREPQRLIASGAGHRTYADLGLALRVEAPEVVVVCVNEEAHFDVLDAVLSGTSVRHVVCEKPLTRTLEEYRRLAPERYGIPISVNFCERYSPVIDDCVSWLARHGATVARVEFGWGKYRVRDPRPTMGVLSEFSHPLDLSRYLLGAPAETPLRLASAAATYSDFSSFADRVSDGVSLVGDIGGCLVVGSSSFVWEERRRRLVLYARATGGRSWMLVLDFDNPVWDNDTFSVYELEPVGGRRVLTEQTRHQALDLPEAVRHVQKIYRYLLDVADSLAGAAGGRFAGLGDARWAQTTLEEIGARAEQTTSDSYARLFAAEAVTQQSEVPRRDPEDPCYRAVGRGRSHRYPRSRRADGSDDRASRRGAA
jgi:predicted dehydrogenase